MWECCHAVSCATNHFLDPTGVTNTTFITGGHLKAHLSLVRSSSAEIWSEYLLTKCCEVFPYTAEDGSAWQQLRSTHTQKLKALYPSLHTSWYTEFWKGNPVSTGFEVQECREQTLCGDYCRECRPDRMVYFAHRDCWKVAFSCHRWSHLDWSRLAVQTRPFEIRTWRMKNQLVVCHEEPVTPILASVPPIEGKLWTRLGRLLARIRLLPAELQRQIMGHLKGTMFASLLQAKKFVLEVMPRLPSESTWTIQAKTKFLREVGQVRSDSLSCGSVNIMGRPYISELGLGQPNGSGSHIPISKKALRGVQFALGRFGLRGIRIWYEDSSFSPWLGETTSCWIGTIRCCDLSDLRVVADVSCYDFHIIPKWGQGGSIWIQTQLIN